MDWFGLTKKQWESRTATLEAMGIGVKKESLNGDEVAFISEEGFKRNGIIDRVVQVHNYEKSDNRPYRISVGLLWYPGREPRPRSFDWTKALDIVRKELAPDFGIDMQTSWPEGGGFWLHFTLTDQCPGRSWEHIIERSKQTR